MMGDKVFQRRVKALVVMAFTASLVVAGRLAQLQGLQHAEFEAEVAAVLSRPPMTLPSVRGAIRDRHGETLVADEPCWDVCFDYAVLAVASEKEAADLYQRYGLAARRPEASESAAARSAAFLEEVLASYRTLARLTGTSPGELRETAESIKRRVKLVREAVSRRLGFEETVREELQAHPIIAGLSEDDLLNLRPLAQRFPWLKIVPSTRRGFHDATAFAHLLGGMGRVDEKCLREDPFSDDPRRRYLTDDLKGNSGVERLAEERLRGARGWEQRDRDGRIEQRVDPVNGSNVRLTLDAGLQRGLYDYLSEKVPALPYSSGAVIVVLDVASRDVLAMVSYPSYDPARLSEDYRALADDTPRLPLWFRAASSEYNPGSIIKPLTCLAVLGSGAWPLDRVVNCQGYLFPDNPDAGASKCWAIAGTQERMRHGPVSVVEALVGSCNIYMYEAGIAMGMDGLTQWNDMAGLGRPAGTGLVEEADGINPTPAWLQGRGIAISRAHARLFAIGQGELQVTPIQAANLAALYADGRYRPVRLLLDEPERPAWEWPGGPELWRALREGLYGVVNRPSGTAYDYARLEDSEFALCGKTGSASTHPRPTRYAIEYTDDGGRLGTVDIPAGSESDALDRFVRRMGLSPEAVDRVTATAFWPEQEPEEGGHAHAWFIGFLQPLDGVGRPDWSRVPPLAFAILIEYGGSGGRVSGAMAPDVSRLLIRFWEEGRARQQAMAGGVAR